MKRQNSTNDEPQLPKYHNYLTSWAICPPSELSNLFYFSKTISENNLEIEKYTGVYMLAGDGITKLLELDSEGQNIKAIRIYMGCGQSTIEDLPHKSTFYPIFAIVTEDGEDRYHFHYTTNAPIWTDLPISGEIAGLFRTHWNQLSDDGIANAFSGLTVNDADLTSVGSLRTRRVKFYEFPKADVNDIVKQLKGTSDLELALMLGAGLTVRVTHPFNFRPILGVPLTTNNSSSTEVGMDSLGAVYFERSQPCPPYCPNGDTGEVSPSIIA